MKNEKIHGVPPQFSRDVKDVSFPMHAAPALVTFAPNRSAFLFPVFFVFFRKFFKRAWVCRNIHTHTYTRITRPKGARLERTVINARPASVTGLL